MEHFSKKNNHAVVCFALFSSAPLSHKDWLPDTRCTKYIVSSSTGCDFYFHFKKEKKIIIINTIESHNILNCSPSVLVIFGGLLWIIIYWQPHEKRYCGQCIFFLRLIEQRILFWTEVTVKLESHCAEFGWIPALYFLARLAVLMWCVFTEVL